MQDLIGGKKLHTFRKKSFKLLFGVPEGEYIARQFACIAASMPDAECRYLGFSWSTGRFLRKMGLDYAHIPWKRVKSQIPDDIPPVFEFIYRGLRPDTLPYSARQTFGTLADFIEREIDQFAPDIIVYGPVEHAICYMVDLKARARGIPTLGIQTSFVANHFIANTHGFFWEDFIRNAEIPDNFCCSNQESVTSRSSFTARRIVHGKNTWEFAIWMRRIELTLRFISGGSSFDSVQSILSTIINKISPRRWFPKLETLEAIEDIQSGCVLVVLHQPSLPWTNPTWVDLIKFALEATPDDVPIVIRPHPNEKARWLSKDFENDLISRGVRISRASHGPQLATLLKLCRTVMTLSSSTGMEALLAGVPVFTLGPAFYARSGLARYVTLPEAPMVREMITNAEKYLPDAVEVDKFTKWVMSECMVPAPEGCPPNENSLLNRIRGMLYNEGHTAT